MEDVKLFKLNNEIAYELYRYKQFEENLFMLDLVNASTLHKEKNKP